MTKTVTLAELREMEVGTTFSPCTPKEGNFGLRELVGSNKKGLRYRDLIPDFIAGYGHPRPCETIDIDNSPDSALFTVWGKEDIQRMIVALSYGVSKAKA